MKQPIYQTVAKMVPSDLRMIIAALREAAAVAWIYGYEFTDVVQERILALIGET